MTGGEAAIVDEHGFGKAPEPLDQELIETEELDLLGGLDAGAKITHIIELPPLGSAEIIEPIALCVELEFAEQRRHKRDQHQHDQPGPIGKKARARALPTCLPPILQWIPDYRARGALAVTRSVEQFSGRS